MSIKLRVHHADELLQRKKLLLHPRLISKEVLLLLDRDSKRKRKLAGERRVELEDSKTYHPFHELDETPERCDFLSFHDDVERSSEVRHALDVAEVFLEENVGEENLSELVDVFWVKWKRKGEG